MLKVRVSSWCLDLNWLCYAESQHLNNHAVLQVHVLCFHCSVVL